MATKKKTAGKVTRKRNGLVLGQDLNKRAGQRGYVYLIWDGKRHDFTNVKARAVALKHLQAAKHGPRVNPCKCKRKNPGGACGCKKKNPAKRKRNGGELESAAKMYGKFHGKAPTNVKTVRQLRVTPSVLADCGKLVELVVATDKGQGVKLSFKGGVRVATTGDGGQLYFVGGDQAVNLRQFPNVTLPKDHVELGEAVSICYHTSKDFHNFEPSDYEHQFGEEGGARPLLAYDVHSQRLYLVGGDYRVKREGIVD